MQDSSSDPGALPRAGEIIAEKYEVERVLGAGGMGVVLCARHLQLGQRVAIKFMRGEWAHDTNAVGRFVREARAAAALSSPHVTRVLDVGTLENGAPYIVMEYLAGFDLGERVRQSGAMAIPDAIGAILQASEAIAEAHSIGIVHRDLKPSNLFVAKSPDGSPLVKVLDFGISKVSNSSFADDGAQTSSGAVMGSPGYMSPEQVRNAKDVDARSDLWAIGVILYEVLTGVTPFRGDTLGETLARILTEVPAPIRTIRPEIPEGLAAAIAQCLERDLKRRVQSVGELATKLLPFAPPGSAASVERIRRLSGLGEGPRSQETVVASSTMTAVFDGPEGTDGGRIETGASWQRSGIDRASEGRSLRGPILIGVAAVVVLLGGLGIYLAGERAASSGRSAAAGEASTGAAAAVKTEPGPTLQGTVTATPPPAVAPAIPPPATAPTPPPPDVPSTTGHDVRVAPPVATAAPAAPANPVRPHPAAAAQAPQHPRPQDPSLDDMLERRQ